MVIKLIDLTSFVNTYISGVLDVVSRYYQILDNIQFFGVSLLTYCITLVLITVSLPLIITLTKSGIRTSKRSYREKSRERSEGNE